jgi:hypothetical protein
MALIGYRKIPRGFKMRSTFLQLLCATAALVPFASWSATIGQTDGNIQVTRAIGAAGIYQSFTAVDPYVTMGFAIGFYRGTFLPDNSPLIMTLYEGDGYGGNGPLLKSQIFSIADPAPSVTTIHDPNSVFHQDFSDVMLTVGSSYTVGITSQSGEGYWSIFINQDGGYDDGQAWSNLSACQPSSPCDFNFEVTGVAATVPIPATVWLFGSGLGLLGWMRRKATV